MFQPFGENVSNEAKYAQALMMIEGTLMGEADQGARLANVSAILNYVLTEINWVGFYLADAAQTTLILGPFQGLPACTRIAFTRGVCGKAARERQTQCVDDVHAIADHIACDSQSVSELVVPIFTPDGEIYGVIDCDSPTRARFTEAEVTFFEAVSAKVTEYLK